MDLSKLPVQQLLAAKKQFEEELNFLAQSLSQLRLVQSRFKASQDAVAALKMTAGEKEILVPLSSSLYVPGQHCKTGEVLIDVGTGYLLTYSFSEADDYYKRRLGLVQKNTEELTATIVAKRQNYVILNEIITERMVSQAK